MSKKRKKERTEARVAVLREHFLILTGDVTEAIILNQLMYWTDIMNKSDEQLIDEIEELEKQGKIEIAKEKENAISEGWFYKSIKKLSDEIMMAAPSTVGKKLQSLEEKGLIQAKRTDDPNEAKYYKVNLNVVRSKLLEIGFTLKGEIIDLQKVEQAEIKGQRKVEKGSRKKKKEEGNKSSNPSPIENTPSLLETPPSPIENTPSPMENKKNTNKDYSLEITIKDHHHMTDGDDDDAGAAQTQPWENDQQYKNYNQLYVNVGADPICDHKKHYDTYQKAVERVGYNDLCEATKQYINEEREKAQIVYFLSGVYNNYLPKKNKKQAQSLSARKEEKPVPQMLKMSQEQQSEPQQMDTEKVSLIHAKLRLMNEKFAERKGNEGRP